jgi:murein DD-endopeptidase MepM/ murein hydrolase activator NlpD
MLAGEYLSDYVWPLRHARITNAFGPGRPGSFVVDGDTIHDGIDLSTFCGDRVIAAHAGVVIATGRERQDAMGWLGDLAAYRARLEAIGRSSAAIAVVVDDGNGFRSVYLHLGRATVKAGDVVRAGQLIGYEGSTGHATGCHLHYALFSAAEPRTYRLDSTILVEKGIRIDEIARIDPLLAMPPLAAGGVTWGWGARTED